MGANTEAFKKNGNSLMHYVPSEALLWIVGTHQREGREVLNWLSLIQINSPPSSCQTQGLAGSLVGALPLNSARPTGACSAQLLEVQAYARMWPSFGSSCLGECLVCGKQVSPWS